MNGSSSKMVFIWSLTLCYQPSARACRRRSQSTREAVQSPQARELQRFIRAGARAEPAFAADSAMIHLVIRAVIRPSPESEPRPLAASALRTRRCNFHVYGS
jgi:hypothetical protein